MAGGDLGDAEESQAEAGEGQEHGKTEEEAQENPEDKQGKSADDTEEQNNGGDGEGEGDEEPGECGFCLFMKSGPCRDSFISWEQCIEQAEKDKEDMVEKCHKVTFILKECMERNSDYYEPVLQAEKAMGDAAQEEEEEEEASGVQGGSNASASDLISQSENQQDAPHPQAPPQVDTGEHNIPMEEHSTNSSSEENHIHASSDAPVETPNSQGAAQERPSA